MYFLFFLFFITAFLQIFRYTVDGRLLLAGLVYEGRVTLSVRVE